MNNEKFLPIGTVCLLKGAKKKVMVTGFLTMPQNNQNEVYDYSGCMYPEGILSSEQTLVFNHSQIEKVEFVGYVNEEEKEFKTKLNEMIGNDSSSETSNTTETIVDNSANIESLEIPNLLDV